MATVTIPVSLGGTNVAYNDGTGSYGMQGPDGYGYKIYLIPMLAETINAVSTAVSAAASIASVTAGMPEYGVTAFAGGGQGSATALNNTKSYHRIDTVASNLDSVKLPAATAGVAKWVRNSGANTVNVYPQTGETINGAAANAPLAVPAGNGVWFVCAEAGKWECTVGNFTSTTTLTVSGAASIGTTLSVGGAVSMAGALTGVTTIDASGNLTLDTASVRLTDDYQVEWGGTANAILGNAAIGYVQVWVANTKVGDFRAAGLAATLTTAAQPAITSVGTLTSLAVSGALSAASVTLAGTNGYFGYGDLSAAIYVRNGSDGGPNLVQTFAGGGKVTEASSTGLAITGTLSSTGAATSNGIVIPFSSPTGSLTASKFLAQMESTSILRSYTTGPDGATYGAWEHYSALATSGATRVFRMEQTGITLDRAVTMGAGLAVTGTLSTTGNTTLSGVLTLNGAAGSSVITLDGGGQASPPAVCNYGMFSQSVVGLGIRSVAAGIGMWVGSTEITRHSSTGLAVTGTLSSTNTITATIAGKTAKFDAAGGSIFSAYDDGTKSWSVGAGIMDAGLWSLYNNTNGAEALRYTHGTGLAVTGTLHSTGALSSGSTITGAGILSDASDFHYVAVKSGHDAWYWRNLGSDTMSFHLNSTGDIFTLTSAGAAVTGTLSLTGATNKSFQIDTAESNSAFFSGWQSTAFLGVNRNPATGAVTDATKAAASIGLWSAAGDSYITFATTTANNDTPVERMRIAASGAVTMGAGLAVTGTLSSTGAATVGNGLGVTGIIDGSGTLRAQGNTIPASGVGLELNYASGTGNVYTFDRTGTAWVSTKILADTTSITVATTGVSVAGNTSITGTLSATDLITASAGISIAGGSFAAGKVYKDAASGLVLASVTGGTNDFVLTTPAGGEILKVATGATLLQVLGGAAITGTLSSTAAITATDGVIIKNATEGVKLYGHASDGMEIYSYQSGTVISRFSSTGLAITGTLSATDTITSTRSANGFTAGLQVTGTGDSGGIIGITGNGATTPSKYIRVYDGALQILNSAINTAVLTLSDAGNLAVTGVIGIGAGTPGANGATLHSNKAGSTANHIAVGNGDNGAVMGVFAAGGTPHFSGYATRAMKFGNYASGGTYVENLSFDAAGAAAFANNVAITGTLSLAGSATIAKGETTTVVSGTSQTAVAGNRYALTNGSASTLTLPASPGAGDIVHIVVANGRVDNVVARNGSTIMGLSEDLTLDNAYSAISLQYINSSWRIV